MNYYPFHIGDYHSATRHLTWDEDAALRRMLDVYYTHERPLPAEDRQVYRLIGAATQGQRDAADAVLREFFTLTDEGWRNRRADHELAELQKRRDAQRRKARSRWDKGGPGGAPGPEGDGGGTPAAPPPAMPRHPGPDAAAPKADAAAMPPRPTPRPKSTPEGVGGAPWLDPDPEPPAQPAESAQGQRGQASGATVIDLFGAVPTRQPTTADVIYGRGVPLLTASGVSERSARSMLGLLRSEHGDEALIEAIQRCADHQALEPVAFLQGALRARAKPAAQPAWATAKAQDMSRWLQPARSSPPKDMGEIIDVGGAYAVVSAG